MATAWLCDQEKHNFVSYYGRGLSAQRHSRFSQWLPFGQSRFVSQTCAAGGASPSSGVTLASTPLRLASLHRSEQASVVPVQAAVAGSAAIVGAGAGRAAPGRLEAAASALPVHPAERLVCASETCWFSGWAEPNTGGVVRSHCG